MNRNIGLVSISFRALAPREIVALAKSAGLECVEWGADVHARPPLPGADPDAARANLRDIAEATASAGLYTSSYGTYFRLGSTPLAEWPAHIEAARILGAPILRAWAGTVGFAKMDAPARARVASAAAEAAAMTADAGMELCLECHPNTATDCPEGAEAMLCGAPRGLAMYWQPNQFHDFGWNVAYLRQVASKVRVAHVFNWKADAAGKVVRMPLAGAREEWSAYFSELPAAAPALLEFMPDDDPASLATEAASLSAILR